MTAPKPAPLLGRLAVHLKMISMDQLAEAIRAQGRAGEDAKLGEILVTGGFIDRGQLAKLISAQQQVLAKQKAKSAPAAVHPAPPIRSAPARAPAPAPVPSAVAKPSEGPAPICSASELAAPTDADRARFETILRRAIGLGGGDVHLHAGSPVQIRISGRLTSIGDAPLERADAERLVRNP